MADKDKHESEDTELDPKEFVRALLHISPEDAEEVRERTPGTRQKPEEQEGPSADYGDESGTK